MEDYYRMLTIENEICRVYRDTQKESVTLLSMLQCILLVLEYLEHWVNCTHSWLTGTHKKIMGSNYFIT